MTDVVLKFLTLIANYQYKAVKVQLCQLVDDPVNEFHAVDFNHAFCVVFGVFSQTLAHSGSQYYCLHNKFFISLVIVALPISVF